MKPRDYNCGLTLSPGARLGPYEIVAPIGAGSMGEVYRAHDRRLNRDVAVKVLPASLATDADRLRRFAQEARAAAALNHPNVVAVFDVNVEGEVPFVVSELLDGETLAAASSTASGSRNAPPPSWPGRSPSVWPRRMRRGSCTAT